MIIKTLIIFPYSGYELRSKRERVFWEIVDKCNGIDNCPVIVLNRDTEIRQKADTFLNNVRSTNLDVVKVWSVDTCQMWLSGWGHIIDNYKDCSRIVQIPGDIDTVKSERRFFSNLTGLIQANVPDIVIGDFHSQDQYSSKELIDTYGTYPLMSNWFPQVTKKIQSLPLLKPRSEFLNFNISILKELLCYRKFAYEQTLNSLIRSWNCEENKWRYNINIQFLGELEDDKTFRQYRDTLDQIERTERMLKLLWREINEPKETGNIDDDEFNYKSFSAEYDLLDKKSTGMRESARTTIKALLGA